MWWWTCRTSCPLFPRPLAREAGALSPTRLSSPVNRSLQRRLLRRAPTGPRPHAWPRLRFGCVFLYCHLGSRGLRVGARRGGGGGGVGHLVPGGVASDDAPGTGGVNRRGGAPRGPGNPSSLGLFAFLLVFASLFQFVLLPNQDLHRRSLGRAGALARAQETAPLEAEAATTSRHLMEGVFQVRDSAIVSSQ